MTAPALPSETLARVRTAQDVAALPPEVEGVFVLGLSDALLAALGAGRPTVRDIVSDGNNSVTDAGLQSLPCFSRLRSLDLEWSLITDAGLDLLAAVASLRHVDLSFCAGLTAAGLATLRQRRPDLHIE